MLHDADATRNPLGAVAKQAEAANGDAGADERRPSHQSEVEAGAAAGDGTMRPELLLGITLQGVREFAERHWGGVCDPDVPGVRGAAVPADAPERDALVAALRDAGHTNSWPGDCPVLRVLGDDSDAGGAAAVATTALAEDAAAVERLVAMGFDESSAVLDDALARDARPGTPLRDAVRYHMNGYNNQTAILAACPEGASWCETL